MTTQAVSAPMIEFLRWLDGRMRTVTETFEAWQTSCPRLSLWEDAQIEGLVSFERLGAEVVVRLTPKAEAILATA